MTTSKKYPVKCFLLSAGLGERLRPLTETIPKCLLPIGGKPLLEIWIQHLRRHGIDEILINTHWRHEKVEVFLKTWEENHPKVTSFYERTLLGSAGTLFANRTWLTDDEPFFIIYGDNLTNVDLTKMLAYHTRHGMPFTLGVFRTDKPKECGIADISNDSVVTGFVEKPEEPTSNMAAAGVYVADGRIFDFFPKPKPFSSALSLGPLDLGFHVIPRLVGNMKAYLIQEPLIDIGTPEAYEKAQTLWHEVIEQKN